VVLEEPVSEQRRAPALWPTLRLLAAWLLLGLLLDLRYPGPEVWRPSLDATVLVLFFVLVGARGGRLPRVVPAILAVLVVVVRLFRLGDGVVQRYFGRPLSLALDLATAPELVRLLRSTLPRPALTGAVALLLVLLVAVGWLAAWCARTAARCGSSAPATAIVFLGLAGLLLVLTPFIPGGLVADSVVPRLWREGRDVAALPQRRREAAARVRATDERLRGAPHDLQRLQRASVFLFLVESYGATVIERPDHARRIEPVYAAAERRLQSAGFQVVSRLLSSPTYAGRSWLAQETLATGVRTSDRLLDEEVQRQRPTTMARLFRAAGYQTVLAQPGSTHRGLHRWVYDFERVYSAWDFDYRGPAFRWSPMPDQYVVDFIHRRVVTPSPAPLLVEYALVTSHAPWSDQPALVDDWSRLGDGAVFATLPRHRYPVGWTNLSDGSEAYLRSVTYDLEVLVRYVIEFAPAGALVVILGDHQPVAEVTGGPSDAVPIHVISGNPALLAPFRARGYREGMRPLQDGAPPGLETFLPALLADFSIN